MAIFSGFYFHLLMEVSVVNVTMNCELTDAAAAAAAIYGQCQPIPEYAHILFRLSLGFYCSLQAPSSLSSSWLVFLFSA